MAWDNAIVPKHAFILWLGWLAIKDRLTTLWFLQKQKWNAGITCFLIAHKLILSEGMEAGLVAVAEATYSM